MKFILFFLLALFLVNPTAIAGDDIETCNFESNCFAEATISYPKEFYVGQKGLITAEVCVWDKENDQGSVQIDFPQQAQIEPEYGYELLYDYDFSETTQEKLNAKLYTPEKPGDSLFLEAVESGFTDPFQFYRAYSFSFDKPGEYDFEVVLSDGSQETTTIEALPGEGKKAHGDIEITQGEMYFRLDAEGDLSGYEGGTITIGSEGNVSLSKEGQFDIPTDNSKIAVDVDYLGGSGSAYYEINKHPLYLDDFDLEDAFFDHFFHVPSTSLISYNVQGNIKGEVHEKDGDPLQKTNIRLINNTKEATTTTDKQGNYSFGDINIGEYTVVFEDEDYEEIGRIDVFMGEEHIKGANKTIVSLSKEQPSQQVDFVLNPGKEPGSGIPYIPYAAVGIFGGAAVIYKKGKNVNYYSRNNDVIKKVRIKPKSNVKIDISETKKLAGSNGLKIEFTEKFIKRMQGNNIAVFDGKKELSSYVVFDEINITNFKGLSDSSNITGKLQKLIYNAEENVWEEIVKN